MSPSAASAPFFDLQVNGYAGVDFQSGDPSWWRDVPARTVAEKPASPELAASKPRRVRTSPSGGKAAKAVAPSAGGMAFGSEVHAAFEAVGAGKVR